MRRLIEISIVVLLSPIVILMAATLGAFMTLVLVGRIIVDVTRGIFAPEEAPE